MKIIQWYLIRTLTSYCAVTLFSLSALSSLIKFIDQLRFVGKGSYTFFDNFVYVLLLFPKDLEMFAPMAVLLGCLLGMGQLAARSEIIALQSAGISKAHIIGMCLKGVIPLVIAFMVLSEFVTPKLEDQAKQLRSIKVSEGKMIHTLENVWVKDGQQFLRIDGVVSPTHIKDVQIYQFGANNQLEQIIHAASAHFKDHQWQLNKAYVRKVNSEPYTISAEAPELLLWKGQLSPEQLKAVSTASGSMSITNLIEHIRYLQDSKQDSSAQLLKLAKKVLKPINIMLMTLLALAFIFGSLRQTSMSYKMMVGILWGFGYYISNEMAANAALVYHFPIWLGVVITPAALGSYAAYKLSR
jgi:lipopolysaccharide export system permease protein